MEIQAVVIALIKNQSNEILIAKRQSHQSYPGLWEFPGGKIETGEHQLSALQREIFEEVNLNIVSARHLDSITQASSTGSLINMHIWECLEYTGLAYGKEGQFVKWVPIDDLCDYSFPPANQVLIKWLTHALRSA